MAVVADTAAPPTSYPRLRAWVAPSLRVGVAVAGLAILARTVGLTALGRIVTHADPRLLLAAAVLGTAAQGSAMLPWRMLLPADDRLRWPHLTAMYLRATFAGQVLPTGLGGDAVRAVETGRVVGSGPALAAVAAGRFLGVAAMAVWALAASAALGDRDGAAVPAVAAGLVVAVAVLAAATLWSARTSRRRHAGGAGRRRLLAEVVDHLRAYAARPRLLLAALAASVAGWGLTLAAMVVFGRALGADVDWDVLAGALPLSLAVTLLPITVNGLGVREGVLVAMLGVAGVGASTAAALAAFADLQALPLALAGAALWAARRRTGDAGAGRVIEPKETPRYGASAPAVMGAIPPPGAPSPQVAPGSGRLSRGGLPRAATEPTMNHSSTTFDPLAVPGAEPRG